MFSQFVSVISFCKTVISFCFTRKEIIRINRKLHKNKSPLKKCERQFARLDGVPTTMVSNNTS